jgi:hypothetical protein
MATKYYSILILTAEAKEYVASWIPLPFRSLEEAVTRGYGANRHSYGENILLIRENPPGEKSWFNAHGGKQGWKKLNDWTYFEWRDNQWVRTSGGGGSASRVIPSGIGVLNP